MSELRDKNGMTEAEFLAAYRPGDWPHPSVTADQVLLSKEDGGYSVLLIRRGGHPCLGQWALPGGFVESQEPPWKAAARELQEETGLEDIPAVMLGVFGDPNRDPRGWTITCAYCALVDRRRLKPQAGDDAREARWFRLSWSRQGEELLLGLDGGEEQLTARLRGDTAENPLGRETRWILLENQGLAFDHAKVLATAADLLEQTEN